MHQRVKESERERGGGGGCGRREREGNLIEVCKDGPWSPSRRCHLFLFTSPPPLPLQLPLPHLHSPRFHLYNHHTRTPKLAFILRDLPVSWLLSCYRAPALSISASTSTSTMISDGDLYRLAIFLGSCAMMMIVLYHFLDVNASDEEPTDTTTKSSKPIESTTASSSRPTATSPESGNAK